MSIYHPDYLPLPRFSTSSHSHYSQHLLVKDLYDMIDIKLLSEYGTRLATYISTIVANNFIDG